MLAIKIVDRVINVIGEFLLLGLTHLYHRSISKSPHPSPRLPPPPPPKKKSSENQRFADFFQGVQKETSYVKWVNFDIIVVGG